ncbi:caspase recruitment domain-containing protein 19 isoform X2 [Tiliqua scincoides]|uniref:caspase recruitment domain-containing protein 19 isoform X2 n=1 Tax=Tiliqua scincoides TaxID=71010 RepID=UPI00346347E1
MPDQSYCDRLRQDMAFLTSNGRLSEQLVDKIILQLNRVYPQILTNKEAEKFRNPKASLHSRLSNLIDYLQKKGDRPCQEFYRALQINAEQLYNSLPSRKILKIFCRTAKAETSDSTGINPEKEKCILNDRGPTFFLACFSVAAGLAIFMYCCNPELKSLGKAKKVLGFSPIIIRRHISNICMLYMEDSARRQ